MRTHRNTWLSVLAISLIAATCATLVHAAEEPRELVRLRDSYHHSVEGLIKPLKTRYIRDLTSLKKRLSSEGDLEGALLVEDEIDRTEARFVIVKATWGSSRKQTDVTEVLRKQIKDQKLKIKAGKGNMNQLLGNPDTGQIKTLTVEYIHNGKPKSKTFRQSTRVSLP